MRGDNCQVPGGYLKSTKCLRGIHPAPSTYHLECKMRMSICIYYMIKNPDQTGLLTTRVGIHIVTIHKWKSFHASCFIFHEAHWSPLPKNFCGHCLHWLPSCLKHWFLSDEHPCCFFIICDSLLRHCFTLISRCKLWNKHSLAPLGLCYSHILRCGSSSGHKNYTGISRFVSLFRQTAVSQSDDDAEKYWVFNSQI